MGGCQSQSIHQEIEPFIIMWVLKISDFLRMELPLPKHEELQAGGLLHRREVVHYCLFVSHQWLSMEHPDPEGKQQRVLQECLQGVCSGHLSITNDVASQFFGEKKTLTQEQAKRVKEGFIWLDWVSIPQIETFHDQDDEDDEVSIAKRNRSSRTFAYKTPARPRRTDQEEFILSIPSFVQACQVFVALVPPLMHFDTRQLCNYASWSTRGWCRTEMWCKMMLGNQDMPVVVISAADQADFARPVNWVDHLPHEGQFSVPADRGVVNGIFEQALSHQLGWLEQDSDPSLYRYFLARRENLIGVGQQRRRLPEFLEEFGFGSLKDAKRIRRGFGPILAAALSADTDLLKTLLEAACSVEQRLKAMPEVGVVGGMTTMQIVLLQGWRSPHVLKILLEARADPNSSSQGVPLLACCRTARDVELLVKYRGDVCKLAPPLKVPAIALASGESTPPEVIAKLLELRASPNGPAVSGLGIAQPLSFVAVNAKSNPHAVQVAKLLLEARADVNQQCSASGIFFGVEVFSRCYIQVAQPRSMFMFAAANWSTSSFGVACLFGGIELVELCLDAKGDVNLKNSRGKTPLDLARSAEVRELLIHQRRTSSHSGEMPELEDLNWKPEDWATPAEASIVLAPILSAHGSSASARSSGSFRRSSPGLSSQSSEGIIVPKSSKSSTTKVTAL